MKRLLYIFLSVMILTIVGCGDHSESGNSDVVNSTIMEESKYVADMKTATISSSKESKDDSLITQVSTTAKEETSTSNYEDSKDETPETNTEESLKGEESPKETPTEATVVYPTVPASEPVEISTKPTASKYDINSTEYQNEVKQLTIQYINQYRASEGQVALSESPSASAFAQGRSKQLIGLKVFEHNTDDIRALATEMKYGRYINPQEFGARGEPYYEPYGIEAISKQAGNQYFSTDEVAKKIAKGFYNSKEHWQYIGGVGSVYVNDVYAGEVIVSKGTSLQTIATVKGGTGAFTLDLPINNGYKIAETKAPYGYVRNTADVYSFRFDYLADNQATATFTHTYTDERVKAKIQLNKVDLETGVPQGDAKLEGAVY